MSEKERRIHHEILERIEPTPGGYNDAGNKVLTVTIDYKKEAYRNRPRGYYLCLSVYLETDRGYTQHCLSFGDEGDPRRDVLIEETKAFSKKRFDALEIVPETLGLYIGEMKAEYRRRRDLQIAKEAQRQHRELATV